MKRRTGKKKIVFTNTSLIIISLVNMILLGLLATECDNIYLFVISKTIFAYIIYVNSKLLIKYMPKRYI